MMSYSVLLVWHGTTRVQTALTLPLLLATHRFTTSSASKPVEFLISKSAIDNGKLFPGISQNQIVSHHSQKMSSSNQNTSFKKYSNKNYFPKLEVFLQQKSLKYRLLSLQ